MKHFLWRVAKWAALMLLAFWIGVGIGHMLRPLTDGVQQHQHEPGTNGQVMPQQYAPRVFIL